jgi:hypothetical protein
VRDRPVATLLLVDGDKNREIAYMRMPWVVFDPISQTIEDRAELGILFPERFCGAAGSRALETEAL